MLEPLLEEPDDVVVVEAVEDQAAGAPRAHKPHAPKQAELVRHGRFGRADPAGQIADAQLPPRERVEHPNARGIAEHPEGLGEVGEAVIHERNHMNI